MYTEKGNTILILYAQNQRTENEDAIFMTSQAYCGIAISRLGKELRKCILHWYTITTLPLQYSTTQ